MSLMKTGLGELLGILLGKHEEVVEIVKKATVTQSGKGGRKLLSRLIGCSDR